MVKYIQPWSHQQAFMATVVFSLSSLSMKPSKMATRNLPGCSRTDLVAMEIHFFWSKISEVWESLVLLNNSSSQNFQHIFRSPVSRVTEDLLSKYDTVPERTKRGFLSLWDYFDSVVEGSSWFLELCITFQLIFIAIKYECIKLSA